VESLGARLKREREKRKITLDEISLSTKIGTRFLLAIEQENFDQLPGGIFNKGFVKAYARSVGVDEAEAVAEYELATGASLPESLPEGDPAAPAVSTPAFTSEDPGDGASRIPWGWFAVALLIVAFGIAVWGFYSREKSSRPNLLVQPVEPGNSSSGPPSAVANMVAGHPVAGQTAAAARSESAVGPSVPASFASGVDTALVQSQDARAAAGESRAAQITPDLTSAAGAFLVQIKAREDSWVVISADGRQIMQAMLNASAEKSVGARDQIVIKTGNAGALDISFNGKRLPAQGAPNEVKTLTFDPHGPKP
jgi:cytoskeleton protein RodZ